MIRFDDEVQFILNDIFPSLKNDFHHLSFNTDTQTQYCELKYNLEYLIQIQMNVLNNMSLTLQVESRTYNNNKVSIRLYINMCKHIYIYTHHATNLPSIIKPRSKPT